jgi:U1 small nuclear ribonucleoprotein
MTDKLPPNLLALFAPRPALRWVPPSDHAPEDRKTATVSGLAAFLPALEEYKKTDVYEPTESWLQKRDRLRLEKREMQERLLKEGPDNCGLPLFSRRRRRRREICRYRLFISWLFMWMVANMILIDKPNEDPNIRGDAFKTLVVARLSYDATEQDLEREFGRFGPIERIRIVTDTHADEKPNKKKKKHRGYAFVVFEREKDMRGNDAPHPPCSPVKTCYSTDSAPFSVVFTSYCYA